MSLPNNLGRLSAAITSDASLNLGVGVTPSGTYKFEVGTTSKFTGVATFGSTISNGTYTYTLPSATGTLALTSALSGYLPLTGGTLTNVNATLSLTTNGAAGAVWGQYTTLGGTSIVGGDNGGGSLSGGNSYCLFIGAATGRDIVLAPNNAKALTLASTGAATFSSSVTATSFIQTNTLLKCGTGSGKFLGVGSDISGGFLSTDFVLYNTGGDLYSLATGGVGMIIKATSGNVGIGTTSPAAFTKLQIAGTAGSQVDGNQQLFITAPTTSVGEGAGIRLSAASGAKEAVGIIGVVNAASGNMGAMTFHVYNAGSNVPEYMRITSSGNVLVGTTTDNTDKLQVLGNITSLGSNASLGFQNRSGTSNTFVWYATSGTAYFYNSAVGNIASINPTTGVYTALSDINKKKDFQESTIGLNAILGLKPTLYRMKDENNTNKHLGFIAQEVKDIIPQAYTESGDFIGLDYQAITSALVKAVQELSAQIKELQTKINK